eukprot:532291-Rhodomonas_salina.4
MFVSSSHRTHTSTTQEAEHTDLGDAQPHADDLGWVAIDTEPRRRIWVTHIRDCPEQSTCRIGQRNLTVIAQSMHAFCDP